MTTATIETAAPSFGQLGARLLDELVARLGLSARQREARELLDLLLGVWGDMRVNDAPPWRSDVCDDGTPFEFSIAFSPNPTLRILSEPIGLAPSLAANGVAAWNLLTELRDRYGADISRAEKVWDLFVPSRPQGEFAVWVAAEIPPEGSPAFKIYFNPEAQGPRRSLALVAECFARLGLADPLPTLHRTTLARGRRLDEIRFVSLDLSIGSRARLKVYARHHDVGADDLERAALASASYEPGTIRSFLSLVGAPDRLEGRAPWTCLAYVSGEASPTLTTHYPINGYVRSDAQAVEASLACFERYGIDPAGYVSSMEVLAPGPLARVRGTQSYLSLRRGAESERLTVYLPPQSIRPQTVAGPTKPRALNDGSALVKWFDEVDDLAELPTILKLGGEAQGEVNQIQVALGEVLDATRRGAGMALARLPNTSLTLEAIGAVVGWLTAAQRAERMVPEHDAGVVHAAFAVVSGGEDPYESVGAVVGALLAVDRLAHATGVSGLSRARPLAVELALGIPEDRLSAAIRGANAAVAAITIALYQAR
jgi:DMATS type aromatic prenyltransferase